MPVDFLDLDDFVLEGGATLRPARLAYRTYGTLDRDGRNAVLYPTAYADRHPNNEWLIGPGAPLDTDRYFVVVPNMFGNGLSSSPSNTPAPYDGPHFPRVQRPRQRRRAAAARRAPRHHPPRPGHGLVDGCRADLPVGGEPPRPRRAGAAFCGSPRTSPHNQVFIEGLRAALTADSAFAAGRYDRPPTTGLRAFGRVYAGWGFSQAFYWHEQWRDLGFSSLEDFIANWWEATFLVHDANDLLAMLDTWQAADVGGTPGHGGNLESALGAIEAPLLSLPAEKDLYFPPEDEQWASTFIRRGDVRVIPGIWGHLAGRGANPKDNDVIGDAIRELLARPV